MMTTQNFAMLGALALLTVGGLASEAHATPYAYASNQITGLAITYVGGGAVNPTSNTTRINDSALFDSYAGDNHQAQSTAGAAATIPQAYSGPGPAPAAVFTADGPTFTGARSLASIGAGTAMSGVAVDNVAEGNGNALGNSNGINNATASFTVTGTGKALAVSFNDFYSLMASTAGLLNETANATIGNVFSITAAGSTTALFTYQPGALNQTVASQAGIPPSASVSSTFAASFTTPTLTNGVSYNISLTSTASESIQPGTSVPEPASLALLGTALVALGARRRRNG